MQFSIIMTIMKSSSTVFLCRSMIHKIHVQMKYSTLLVSYPKVSSCTIDRQKQVRIQMFMCILFHIFITCNIHKPVCALVRAADEPVQPALLYWARSPQLRRGGLTDSQCIRKKNGFSKLKPSLMMCAGGCGGTFFFHFRAHA